MAEAVTIKKSKRQATKAISAICAVLAGLSSVAPPVALADTEHAKKKKEIAGEKRLKAAIGEDVPVEIWRDVSVTPWAVLFCIHGLSLHAKSYASFGRAMSHLGLPTYAIDVRGFGSWKDAEGAQQLNFAGTFNDIKNALAAVRRVNPGLPVVIVGESMGGALALQSAAAYPDLVDGLICSVPSRRNNGQKTTNLKAALGLIYSPDSQIDVGDKVIKRATKQPSVAEEWEHDPLTRKGFSAKELIQFRNLMKDSSAKAEQIEKTPVLFLQGGSDRLIKPTGTLDLFGHLKTTDKDLVMVGTAEHLILEQGQFGDEKLIKDDVVSLITNWVDKHVANPESEEEKADAKKAAEKGGDESNSDPTRLARGHYKMAEGSLLLNDPEMAKDHLLTVLRLARGTALAQKADTMLLGLPEHLIAPPVNDVQHSDAKLVSINAAKSNNKPSILVFCAPWIEACKNIMNDLSAAVGIDGEKVNIVYINADKEESRALLDEYGVKPLPAVLYLNSKNQVVRYTLGDPGIPVMRSRFKMLLEAEGAKPDSAKSDGSQPEGTKPEASTP